MQQRLGFIKGLQTDLSPTKIDPDSYQDAWNISLDSDESGTIGSITNERGTNLLFTLHSAFKLVGWAAFQNYILLFANDTRTEGELPILGGRIWKLEYNPETDSITNLPTPSTTVGSDEDTYLIYRHVDLVFDDEKPIKEVIFRYTNENNIKMYWVDGNNLLRHINIAQGHIDVPLTMLEVVSESDVQNIAEVEEVVGGYYKAGKIQYAYQLFNLDGSESLISPCSPVYSIFPNFEGDTSREARGGKPEEECNKSFRITINGLDTNFQAIRLIAIHYEQPTIAPWIRVVYEADFKDGEITLVDTGAITLAEYSQAEFRTFNNRTLIPNTITTKDNRIILGNVREEYFDIDEYNGSYWDARAYRWDDGGNFKIDGVVKTTSDLASVSEYADCILEPDDFDTYKFQEDGETIGGSGINISYEFVEDVVTIDENRTNFIYHHVQKESEYTTYFPFDGKSILASYKREETYRTGVVFADTMGRTSFVKWISDIKIPNLIVDNSSLVYGHSNLTRTKPVGIKFTVNNVPEGLKFFIVRVIREDHDKSIIAQGILGFLKSKSLVYHPLKNLINNRIKHYQGAGDEDQNASLLNVFTFKSPEISFNKSINIPNDAELKLVGLAGEFDPDGGENLYNDYRFRKITGVVNFEKYAEEEEIIIPTTDNLQAKIIDYSVMNDDENVEYVIKRTSSDYVRIRNIGHSESDPVSGYNGKGTSMIVSLDDNFTYGTADQTPTEIRDLYYIAEIVVDRFGKQYGGNKFIDRTRNQYIKCSDLFESSEGPIEVVTFNGDTYCQYFSFIESTVYESYICEAIHLPVETSYDLYNRTDLNPNSIFVNRSMRETRRRGLEDAETLSFIGSYPDYFDDLYTYNPVYSREADAQLYYPKPYYARFEKNFSNRVIISDKYLGIELSDPWLKFPFDQQTDVDSNHGQINKLINFRDNILFFQNTAFGVIPINERRVLSPENQEQSELTIGRGDLISDYKYLSERSGCQSPYAAIKTNAGIYWLDMINRKFNVWNDQGLQSLSDKLAVSNIFSSYYFPDNSYLQKLLEGKGVQLSYNSKNNRVLILLLREDQGQSPIFISYNEKLGVFESKYSVEPYLLLDMGNTTLALSSALTKGYSLFKGECGKNFDSTTKDNFVIYKIANDQPLFKKTFNNIEFNSSVVDSVGVDVPDETLNVISGQNSYQNGTQVLTPGDNIIRRSRTWRTTIPRASGNSRMIDYYLGIGLVFNNNDNKKFMLDDLIVSYLIPTL